MNDKHLTIQQKVSELLEVLDRDIEHIEQNLSRFSELRGLVIKRDEKALGLLLEDIRIGADEYAANDRRRSSIRNELADLLGCKPQHLRLSALITGPAVSDKTAVAQRQQKLNILIGQLKKEYLCTASLVSDCARINSAVLKGIFECCGRDLVCYDSTGSASRRIDTAFMSMRM